MKFETYEAAPGSFRWRLRDDRGHIVSVKPGKVMGLGAAADTKAAVKAVNHSLARLSGKAKSPGRKRRPDTTRAAKA